MQNSLLLIIIIFGIVILIVVWLVLRSDGETDINLDISKGKLGIKRKR